MVRGRFGDLVLALDVGTTGVRALLLDETGTVAAQAYREALPECPAPGQVEHDLEALERRLHDVAAAAVRDVEPARIRGVGVAAQRSTAVVWDAASGRPLGPGLSWQDTRTQSRCQALMARGLMITPLMAASKIEWLLDRADPDRGAVRAGRLRCGTLDAWLTARLTGGAVQATDASNASCTGLYDLLGGGWNGTALEALRIPETAMPSIVDSGGVLGRIAGAAGLAAPLAAVIGDQQAAMMGHLRLDPGEVKITYGTAAMLDLNAGPAPLFSMHGAYPLVAWQRNGRRTFCLEGAAITAGAAILWLRDGLGIIADVAESDALAASVPDSGGVWVVPAFQGLGTPYLEPNARAVVGGLSRASTRAHVLRAVLEGIAWRCREVYDALRADSPHAAPGALRADGGAARSDVLLQVQADALGIPVERPVVLDAAALGAAYLAGLATGVWRTTDELRHVWRCERTFEPRGTAGERAARLERWRSCVAAARITGETG